MAKKTLKTPHNNNGVQRSTRVKYPVQRLTYDDFVVHHYAYMVKVIQEVEPTCFEQAVKNLKWDNAMDEEMAVLDANATWEYVVLPKDKKAIGCKWVYKIKHNVDGSVSRYKARLVAKGYA
jgi:histone deacetylase 1/2